MKITKVEPLHLRLPDVREIADGTQDVLLVRVLTDAGIVGIGEVTSQSYVCKAIIEAPRSAKRRHGLDEICRGLDPLDIEGCWQTMYEQTIRYGRRGAAIHAISGVDLALWDIKGKAHGKPVYELLGGREQKGIRAYASVLFGDAPEETGSLAEKFVANGLTAVKFGWGPFGKDWDTDREHLEAARSALGDEKDLMVDVGHVWDAETAIERCQLMEPFRPFWVEEPLTPDDIRGYGLLCGAANLNIAAGEADVTAMDFERLMDEGGLHVIQPDVAFAGGLSVCWEVSQMARKRDRLCVPHCFSTGVNQAASIHWMTAYQDAQYVEYCLAEGPLIRELIDGVPPLEDGYVTAPNRPGFGIEINEEVLERFIVR
ncbi:MAG: mandelate racemase/muconate lactonizing enzyme family protein [Planctomycetota bacterium]|jgi:L-alanine-DL-glutamate epimerase-like enolase superfamily enzyme|nr:mandelate racemase/muconate lactonizing enzyme family protein [Planctomycetota bacterium]